MNDSTRRGLRTAIDFLPAVLLACAACFADPDFRNALTDLGLGGLIPIFSAVVLVLLTLISKIKNALEDAGKIPALLKAPASQGENPVPDPNAVTVLADTGNTFDIGGGVITGARPLGGMFAEEPENADHEDVEVETEPTPNPYRGQGRVVQDGAFNE